MNNNMENYVSRTSGVPDMTQYIGTKIVNAKPMNRGEFNCFMEGDPAFKPVGYINGATADDKGYLVEYLDGGKPNKPHLSENYLSWSPADVFEKAYKVVQAVSQNELTAAFAVVSKAMQTDGGYAQSWHSNLACLLTDAGVPHDIATIRAARFMNLAFGANTSLCGIDPAETYVSGYQEVAAPVNRYIVERSISRHHQTVTELYLVAAGTSWKAVHKVQLAFQQDEGVVLSELTDIGSMTWRTDCTYGPDHGIVGWQIKQVGQEPTIEEAEQDSSLDFGSAISAMEVGKRVARAGWNGKGMWLALVSSGNFDVGVKTVGGATELLPWIGMKTADNKFVPWQASQADMLAKDWIITD